MNKFSIKKLDNEQKELRKRILQLSFSSRLSHLGSCLSAVDLINSVYKIKRKDEKFILSNGHAGIAWYAILEKYGYIRNIAKTTKLNIHPDRNVEYDIHVSTGSLGQGLPIAIGIALADRNKNVYCMISDGECAEGSVWESLRIASEKNVNNLKIIVNANGWGAYDKVNLPYLIKRIKAFGHIIAEVNGHDSNVITKALKSLGKNRTILFAYTSVDQFPFLNGQDAHYYILKREDLDIAMQSLS